MKKNHPPISQAADLTDQLLAKQLREKAIQRLEEGLAATHAHFDITTRAIVYTPDHKTRLAAAATLLAYTDGKPIERREKITMKFDTIESLQAKLDTSPALQAAVREIAEKYPEKPASEKK